MTISELVVRLMPGAIADRIAAMPLGRRLAKGVFWTLIGGMAARVLRVPVSVILARMMGSVGYGELGIASASIELFCSFAGLALGVTATKYIAELRVKDRARTGAIIAVSSIVATLSGWSAAVVLFFMAPWLASHTLAAPQLTIPLRIGTLALAFSSMNGAQTGALYGFEAFQVTARIQAIIGIVDLPCMLGGYLLGGLNGVLWGMGISRFLNWLLMHQALKAEARRHSVPLIFGQWRQELSVLWNFSIPAAFGGLMVIPVNWVCSTLIVNRPQGYAEMGAFNAASQWYNTLIFLPGILGSAILPILADRIGERDGSSSERILKVMMKLNVCVVVPCAIGMSLFSRFVMRIYGSGYSEAWPTLIAVVWTAAVVAVSMPVSEVIAASGRMWLGLMMNVAWAAVYILATYLLIHLGSFGLATSRLIAYVCQSVWTLTFAYTVIRRSHRTWNEAPIAVES